MSNVELDDFLDAFEKDEDARRLHVECVLAAAADEFNEEMQPFLLEPSVDEGEVVEMR
jgi:hypothetical protein